MKRVPVRLMVAVSSFTLLVVVGLLFWRLQSRGTILSLVSAGTSSGIMYFEGNRRVGVNQPFKVKMMIDSGKQQVNAAGLFLHYDPNVLQISDMSTLDSFCQFYPEKKFDNRQGIASLACGAPHPGFKGTGTLVEFTFTPLAIGNSTIRVSNQSKLLVSDGKGTNILSDYPLWEVQIGANL